MTASWDPPCLLYVSLARGRYPHTSSFAKSLNHEFAGKPNSWRPPRRADEEIRRGSSESSPGESLMGKCDVMRVTEWLIEWGASQERRSVACHTSEFAQREREITTIVGRVPIIVARYDCQCGKLCDRMMPNPGRYMCDCKSSSC